MGDEDPKFDGDATEFTSESRWRLGGYFFGCDSESSIFSDFGWNLHPDTGEHIDDQLDPISSEILAGNSSNNFAGKEAEIELPGRQASGLHVSTSSSEDRPENHTATGCASLAEPPPSDSACKLKKKGPKRMKQPRFAFMTRSEVDHLEDGYRWRKYGQKAVKNSPFPRSYYRCTNSKCTVKKRVERSSEDPTIVITTYEGQHCHHHSVGSPRVGFANPLAPSASQFRYGGVPPFPQETNPQHHYNQVGGLSGTSNVLSELGPQSQTSEGLLGDIVPSIRNPRS